MRTNVAALRELQRIPGVGPSIAADLVGLRIRTVADLKGKDPERLYAQHCAQRGQVVDRCLLYVFRCAVYFAENSRHDPALLKWWAWKDPAPRRKRS